MTDETQPDIDGREAESNSGSSPFEALRGLLLAPEQARLQQVECQLGDPSFYVEKVSRSLPEAVSRCSAQDEKLAHSLAPMVENVVRLSVKKDPKPLANALYPVIGPAIRRSIAEVFRRMMQSINVALENSLSAKGLRWRWEAIRTGRPFAEIVMLRSLVFRVEQVFLIHRDTGLLMAHVATDESVEENANIVSGMLTALQEFVRDSFSPGKDSEIETIHMEDVSLLVEHSPLVSLVGVIRGAAPEDLRELFQYALERITSDKSAEIDTFDGNTAPFEIIKPLLRSCLESRYKEKESSRRPSFLIVLAIAVCMGLGILIFYRYRADWTWRAFVGALAKEPGIVVVEERKSWLGDGTLRGLRDPLARDPAELMNASGIEAQAVRQQWMPFLSLENSMVIARAARILDPPKTVVLGIEEGVLKSDGSAPHAWKQHAREMAPRVPGVISYDDHNLMDEDLEALEREVSRLSSTTVTFIESDTLAEGMDRPFFASLARSIQFIIEKAVHTGQSPSIVITGHCDTKGTLEYNLKLNRKRAEKVKALLAENGVSSERLEVETGKAGWEDTGNQLRSTTFSVQLKPLD